MRGGGGARESAPAGRLIGRALRRVCPVCGRGRVFASWFRMVERCAVCGYRFTREEGYWTGALIVNMAVAEAWFAVLFAAIVLVTMPNVAWVPLLVAGAVTNTVLPALFYPFSKTLWMALDLHFHPPGRD
jgi:uncharacterized protein (DUF983 family)